MANVSDINMSSTTLDSFLSRATASPYALSLGLGLGTVSYYFWGNVASQFMGAISIPIYPEERKRLGIDTSKGIEIWAWAYKLGAKHLGVSGFVSGLSVMAAAFQLPERQASISRNYLLLLSAGLLSNGIWTVAMMLPTNNRLLAIRDKVVLRKSGSASSASSLTVAEEEEAETLLQKWKQMHYVRIGLGALGYIGTLAAYVTTI